MQTGDRTATPQPQNSHHANKRNSTGTSAFSISANQFLLRVPTFHNFFLQLYVPYIPLSLRPFIFMFLQSLQRLFLTRSCSRGSDLRSSSLLPGSSRLYPLPLYANTQQAGHRLFREFRTEALGVRQF